MGQRPQQRRRQHRLPRRVHLQPSAAKHGITPEAVLSVTKKRTDYYGIVNAPGVTIAVHKALTTGFRPAFRLTEKKFADLDKLIRQFRATAAGRTMISVWNAARVIKDAGHAGGGEAPPPGGGGTTPPRLRRRRRQRRGGVGLKGLG